jgi:hypothetical protein
MPRPTAATMARARCRDALDAAKEADAALSGVWHRFYVETLSQTHRQPADRSVIMCEV